MVNLQVARLIGGAGTGKTGKLLQTLESAKASLGGDPFCLGFASYTKAARMEAADRAADAWGVPAALLTKEGWFKTVHAVCYRQLGIQNGQIVDKSKESQLWLANALGVDVRVVMDEDTGYSRYDGKSAAAMAMRAWDLSRARVEPMRETLRSLAASGESITWAEAVQYVERYENAKRMHDRCDYTDLLGRFCGVRFTVEGPCDDEPEGVPPPGVKMWIFDEAQDASALVDRCCRRLAAAPDVRWVYLAGDPFQCQPAGTPVLTASGYRPIEDLDPESDRLIAYNTRGGTFVGTGGGVRFRKAWRDVSSEELIEITFDDGTKSICTPNHKWVVRTKKRDAYATYLMRKGDRWRIGTVQMFASKPSPKGGEFRLKMRMNQEAADAVWVLRVFDTDREARMYEQVASFRFGIPQVTFRPPSGCKNNLDAEFIDTVFGELGDLSENAAKCLKHHNLEAMFPFCSKADRSKNGSLACRFLQAANLLPGIHVVPKILGDFFERRKRGSLNPRGARSVGREAEWIGISSIRRLPAGTTVRVYSLEVEKHHTYVTTNGIVTGNCIFGFGGSDSKHFMSWKVDKEKVMERSWRCPRPILELGERCLRRMNRGYWDRGIAPADHEGEVISVSGAAAACSRLDPTKPTLVIARCKYTLDAYKEAMFKRRIPHAMITDSDDTQILRAYRAYWDLEHGEPVSGEDLAMAIKATPTRGLDGPYLTRGAKASWAREETAKAWDMVRSQDLPAIGMTPALISAVTTGSWAELLTKGEKWRQAAIQYGPDLATRPQIRLGTIHSTKGMEADDVVLSTQIPGRVANGGDSDPAIHDEERRIEYVGVTRARRRLIVAHDVSDYSMRLPL